MEDGSGCPKIIKLKTLWSFQINGRVVGISKNLQVTKHSGQLSLLWSSNCSWN